MTIEFRNKLTLNGEQSNHAIVACRGEVCTAGMGRRQLAESSNHVTGVFDGSQEVPRGIEYPDDFIGASYKKREFRTAW